MHPSDTRAVILETAARLYADLGYSAVSMRDVAAEVGVTPANLYHHFSGKDELIRETLTHVFAQKTAPMGELLESAGTSDEKLETFVTWFVHLLVEDRIFFRLLVRELVDGDTERLNYLSKTVFDRPFRIVRSLAQTQVAEGGDDFLAAVSILSVMLGHVQLSAILQHLPGGRSEHVDPDVITRHVLAVLRRRSHNAAPAKDA